MQFISVVLRSILIITLFSSIVSGVSGSRKPDLVEQTVEVIKDCMIRSPTPWPDEWKQQYLDTIRKAILIHQDTPQYNLKLEILRKGFESYWGSFKKTPERSLFEVYQARIRWYVDHLMGTTFPSEDERKKLRDQYKDLWDHAAKSLLEQFPFLEPNTVQAAKADDLTKCYSNIDAPLIPVYMWSISEEQVGQIMQSWDKLRYARVDLWRRLSVGSTMQLKNSDTTSHNAKRDYELTKESLSQLLGLVWMVVPQRPDYYLNAMRNWNNALKRRYQSMQKARSYQQHMEKECSRQLLQIEHISFLLTALLEQPVCLDGSASGRTRDKIPSKQREKPMKGDGSYEINNITLEK